MGRIVKNWKPDLVAGATVAPHRYIYNGTFRHDGNPGAKEMADCTSYAERRANLPYVEGEVVYLDRNGVAVKALIYVAHTSGYTDRYGDPREAYKVQIETVSGHWSKLWEIAHPGYIQRGYQRAGLAPDVDRWEPLK